MKILFSLLFVFLLASCSKTGTTVSKIKINGSAVFSGSFGTTASNGMVFYGKSSDGKIFTKILENDFGDFEFPNGVWNFYIVAWDNTSAGSNNAFTGTLKCASSEGVNLTGNDTSLNFTLKAANCDPNKFYSPTTHSCSDLSGVASASSDCLYTSGKKGYATGMRVVVPEFKNFGTGSLSLSGNRLRSDCKEVVSYADTGSEYRLLNLPATIPNIKIPNDLPVAIEAFYSNDGSFCNDAYGFEVLTPGSPQVKVFDTTVASSPVKKFFVQLTSANICKDQRLSTTFASGAGGEFLPFTICTKGQFNNIGGSNFATTQTQSFELLSDLDFQMGKIEMIGNVDGSIAYSGNFNGNNHKIQNAKIECDFSGTNTDNNVAIIRKKSGGYVKNLTVNNLLNFCEAVFAGGVVGEAVDTFLKNIKFFGVVKGVNVVGGVVGSYGKTTSGSTGYELDDLHFNGRVEGDASVGGIAGSVAGSATGVVRIIKNSVSGEVAGNDNTSTNVGGLIGGTSYTDIYNSVIKSKMIQGSFNVGGFAGNMSYGTILNSYVQTRFNANGGSIYSVGNPSHLGGMLGAASAVVISDSFVFNSFVAIKNNPVSKDLTLGGLIGSGTTINCSLADWYGSPNNTHPTHSISCNNANKKSTLASLVTNYTDSNWSQVEGDIPQLAWEVGRENEIPYLKRECVGNSMFQTTPVGSGTLMNPYLICNEVQFLNLSAGSYYKIKRDLNFQGAAFTPKTAGMFLIDGENHFLDDFTYSVNTNGNNGIFAETSSGSVVKNIKLNGAVLDSNSSPLDNVTFGIVSGENYGLLENIEIANSRVGFYNFTTSASTMNLVMGGVAGKNYGVIQGGEVDANLYVQDFSNTSADASSSGPLYIGGIAGKNIYTSSSQVGTIKKIKNQSSIQVESSAGANDMTSNRVVAGIAADNNGVIKEIESDGSVGITNSSFSGVGKVSPMVAINNINGVIQDIHLSGNYSLNNQGPTQIIPDLNGSAVVPQRIIFTPDNFSVPSSIHSFMTQLSNSFCASAEAYLDCYNPANVTYQVNGSNNLEVRNNGTNVFEQAYSIVPGTYLGSSYVWRLFNVENIGDESPEAPEIVSASGSFAKLGEPFN